MIKRIETIYLFIRNKNYNIYDDASKHKSLHRDRPNKQVLYQNYNFSLPLIYDISGYKELYNIGDESISRIICSIHRKNIMISYELLRFLKDI